MKILPKAIVAFAGSRDSYQLPLSLHEEGLLDTFIADFYLPFDGHRFLSVLSQLPYAEQIVAKRYQPGLPSKKVSYSLKATTFALMSFISRRRADSNKRKDHALGEYAFEIAEKHGAALFLYSYYAFSAFQKTETSLPYRFLFQVHPHPEEIRSILREELELTPGARISLLNEPDLTADMDYFQQIAREPHLANGLVVASSFTAKTLTTHGIAQEKIHIVPYGVDFSRFPRRETMPDLTCPLKVIFVGSMVQRKGISYLLDSMRLLKSKHLELVLCGRGIRDEALIDQYKDLNITIKANLSRSDLVQEIHQSDLMVFPSLAEGFAHVILEVMSCGIPVIATSHTCAPDIMEDGKHGFIVPIRNSEIIAEKLEWGMHNRAVLHEMGNLAAEQARQFTWPRFRGKIRQAYRNMLADVDANIL